MSWIYLTNFACAMSLKNFFVITSRNILYYKGVIKGWIEIRWPVCFTTGFKNPQLLDYEARSLPPSNNQCSGKLYLNAVISNSRHFLRIGSLEAWSTNGFSVGLELTTLGRSKLMLYKLNPMRFQLLFGKHA